MGERMDKRIRFYIYWILGFVLLGACAPGDKEDVYTEMRAFEDFSHINGDSVAIVPRKVRLKAFQKMEEAKDSLVKYNYLAMTLKTYLITSQLDSAQIVIQQIHDFIERQHSSSQMADLYNPQIQISAESETKRSIFREKDKTKRSKKESAQHSKSRNKSFVMTSVSAL